MKIGVFSERESPGVSRRRVLRLLAVAPLLAIAAPTAGHGAGDSPRDLVTDLNHLLLTVMQQAEALGFEGRYHLLAAELPRIFDFPTMARAAVGRGWKRIDAQSQVDLIAAFGAFSVRIIAKRFHGYRGERFEVLGEKPTRKQSVLVQNALIKSNGEVIRLDVLTRQRAGRWYAVDFILDGSFSELARLRGEFNAVLKRGGPKALIASLKERTRALQSS